MKVVSTERPVNIGKGQIFAPGVPFDLADEYAKPAIAAGVLQEVKIVTKEVAEVIDPNAGKANAASDSPAKSICKFCGVECANAMTLGKHIKKQHADELAAEQSAKEAAENGSNETGNGNETGNEIGNGGGNETGNGNDNPEE